MDIPLRFQSSDHNVPTLELYAASRSPLLATQRGNVHCSSAAVAPCCMRRLPRTVPCYRFHPGVLQRPDKYVPSHCVELDRPEAPPMSRAREAGTMD